jgi:hypothetical protein
LSITDRVQGINYDYINTPNDVKYVIAKMAKTFQGELEKATKSVSHEELINEADRLIGTKKGAEQRILNWPDGKQMSDPEILLTRMLRNDLGIGLKQAAERFTGEKSQESLVNLLDTFNRYRMIQSVLGGQTSGAARTLESLKVAIGGSGEVEFHRMLGDVTGWTPERLAGAIQQVPDLPSLNRAMDIAARPGMSDMLLEIFYGVDMLSNPRTIATNLVGSPLAMGWQVMKRSIAAGFTVAQGKVGDPNYVQPSEPLMMLQAIKDGFGDAITVADKSFRTGEKQYPHGGGKMGITRPNAISYENVKAVWPEAFGAAEGALANIGVDAQRLKYAVDLLGSAARVMPRIMLASDEFNELIGTRMELYARSARQAAAEGRSYEELSNIAKQKIVDMDYSPADKEAGRQFALYNTFNQEPGTITNRVVGLVESLRKSPDIDPAWYVATKAVLPFVTIPANIGRWAIRESGPTAFLSREIKNQMARGGADAQVAWAGVTLGSMVLTLAANMAMNGYLDGMAPVQKADRQVWEADGHVEYSFNIPGMGHLGFSRLDPIAIPFSWAADFVNLAGHADAYDATTLASMMVLTMTHDMASKNYIGGLTQFLHAVTAMDAKELEQWAKQETTGMLVPGLIRGLRQEADPYRRDVDTTMDAIRAATPLGSTDYPPILDRFGRPVYSGYGASWDWVNLFGILNPLQYRTNNENAAIKELIDNKIAIPAISDTIYGAKDNPYDTKPADSRTGVKLEGWERYLYNKYSGEKLFEMLQHDVTTDGWKRASGGPDGGKAIRFNTMVAAADEYARRRLLGESPQLATDVRAKQEERRQALKSQPYGGVTTIP